MMICQLCHKELILDQEQFNRTALTSMICPVRVIYNGDNKDRRIDVTHFRIKGEDCFNRRNMFPKNYRILEQSDNTFHIYIFIDHPDPETIGSWKYIMVTPAFEFEDEEHLIKKIKRLVVFS